ncbi:MAG: terminase [Actinomycetota bacterium]|nr:terminase [Actinomycetota bacterium]
MTTVEVYELTDSELSLLLEVCRLMDECEALRQAVDDDGTTVPGSNGQPRVHPAVGELRQHRLALGRLLSQLALPDEDEGTLPTPVQARGRQAASKRWAGHVKRGA